MRRDPLITGSIYHICNRSTEGIDIFTNDVTAGLFIKTLAGFNTTGGGLRELIRNPNNFKSDSDPLVEVYAIVLMPNHFHILVRQLQDDGIAKWMQRSCTSFSKTFNSTRNRKGTLFMGRFKAVLVLEDSQLFRLMVYIHGNPLDLISKSWRSGQMSNWGKMKNFLKKYQWSSLGLYNDDFKITNGIKNLINLKEGKSLIEEWGNVDQGIKNWSERSMKDIEHLTFE